MTKKGHKIASIYYRIDRNGNKRFYGSVYHNGKRIRKSLGCSMQSAETLIKKLEYELFFNIQDSNTKSQIPYYEKAILSFLKEVERISVKVKQISDIHTKLNYLMISFAKRELTKNMIISIFFMMDTKIYKSIKIINTGLFIRKEKIIAHHKEVLARWV